MTRNDRHSKYDNYNVDRLDAVIFTAQMANNDTIYVPKRIVKMAKQLLKIKGLQDDIKIKTY